MRHRKNSGRLSRNTSNRKALLRSLVRSLIISERIQTSYAKAKEASSLADRVISLGKRNTITSKKTAISILGSKMLINKLFDDIAPRFTSRKGGYTRILRLASRKGDGAKMALLELTERKIEKPPAKKLHKETREAKGVKKVPPKEEKKEHKQIPKEEKPASLIPPKAAPIQTKEKQGEVGKKRGKSEKEKLRKGFFKGLRRYFRSKSI